MSDIETVIRALGSPADEACAVLTDLLADDVRAAGVLASGRGRDAVLASVGGPASGLLAAATWDPPAHDSDTVTVRGTLPIGFPVAAVVLTVRTLGGKISELIQEVEMPAKPEPAPLALGPDVKAAIDNAFVNGSPVIVTYVDPDGRPHVSFRGTVQTHGDDQLALWARDSRGGLVSALATNPHVALLYRDPNTRTQYEFTGHAHVTDDPSERDRIFEGSPPFEQNIDPAHRGAAIIIDLDTVSGGAAGSPVNMVRHATPARPG